MSDIPYLDKRFRENTFIARNLSQISFNPYRVGIFARYLFVSFVALLLSSSTASAAGLDETNTTHSSVIADVVTLCVLLAVTSLFVLAETALLTVRRTRISQLVEENNRSAKLVEQLLKEPTRMLATLQVGLTMVQLFSAGEAASRFVGPVSRLLKDIPDSNFFSSVIKTHANFIGFVLVISSVGLFTLVLGEIAPKSLAIRHSERLALIAVWPIRWFQLFLFPVVSVVTFLSNAVVRPFGGTTTFAANVVSAEEIKMMVEHSEEHGVIETEEKEMIHNVFEFADTVVRKVMTPRGEFTAIEVDLGIEELMRVVTESGHSRLPVYEGDIDHIVGIIHVKDVLKSVVSGQKVDNLRGLLRPAYMIPENKRVDELLAEFKAKKTQIAFVFDEYGTAIGLVTVEDLLEEIVGEIQDEYDVEEDEVMVQLDSYTAIVDGKMPIDDFNDRMGCELPSEEADTVGGFVFGLLGHMPTLGESVEYEGNQFTVENTDGNRIVSVRVYRQLREEVNKLTENEGATENVIQRTESSEVRSDTTEQQK